MLEMLKHPSNMLTKCENMLEMKKKDNSF